jgi:acyl-CoA thioesterase
MIPIQPSATRRFALDVTPDLCVGNPDRQFLFGGVGLAAGLAAIEAVTERPAVWAAAQYLSYARPGTTLSLDVTVPVSGKYTSQARMVASHAGQEIITVNAALGARPDSPEAQWATMPDVPPPGDCAAFDYDWVRRDDDINAAFEKRVAKGRFGKARVDSTPSEDGIAQLWIRPLKAPVSRTTLAVMADFLPSGVGNALGTAAGGNSLDNTIRFARHAETDWVLADIHIYSTAQGFAHGRAHLFAQDGTLLATASQSLILRIR